ncbi:MAG TPA: nuclear transport factor 2 family protein [Candidatus Limnocylindrales bacterium]
MTDDGGMTEVDGDRANRELVEAFFGASERGEMAALAAMIDDEMVMDWPQSGEQFRGSENVLAAMGAVEVKPQFAGTPRLVGSGEVWVLMVPLRYGEEVLQYVAVLELAAGRIMRATGYWGAPLPARAARAPFVDRG